MLARKVCSENDDGDAAKEAKRASVGPARAAALLAKTANQRAAAQTAAAPDKLFDRFMAASRDLC
jgi:hypothetical protein